MTLPEPILPGILMLRIPRKSHDDGFTSKRGEELYKLLNCCKLSQADLTLVAAEIEILVGKEAKKKWYVRNVLNTHHAEAH